MIKSECFEKEWIDKVCSSHKFKHPELVEKVIRRENRSGNIPKGHYKSFFEVVYSDQIEDSVLLDVLFEDNHYHKIEDKTLSHPFIQTDGSETIIHVPSVADMLGDKLTAFAPNTCGVPYYKGTQGTMVPGTIVPIQR